MVPFDRNKTATVEYGKPDPLHVKSYGMDIIDRIKHARFIVEMHDLVAGASEPDARRYGLGAEALCFVCTKSQSNSAD